MGVHKNGPSFLKSGKQSLEDFILSNKSVLAAHEQGTIQFLFKVLSVKKALSIQSHPNKVSLIHGHIDFRLFQA